MHNFIIIALLLILVAVMIASLVFATKSASDITKITVPNSKSWKNNTNLQDAHNMLTWLAVGGWISVALILFGLVVFLFTGGKEKINGKANPVFIGLLLTVTGVTIAVGVLSILASQNLAKAPNNAKYPFEPGDSDHYGSARKDGILAASLSIGVIGIIVLMWIILIAARNSAKKSKEKAEEANEEKAEEEEVAKNRQLTTKLQQEKQAEAASRKGLNQAVKTAPKAAPKPAPAAAAEDEGPPLEAKPGRPRTADEFVGGVGPTEGGFIPDTAPKPAPVVHTPAPAVAHTPAPSTSTALVVHQPIHVDPSAGTSLWDID